MRAIFNDYLALLAPAVNMNFCAQLFLKLPGQILMLRTGSWIGLLSGFFYLSFSFLTSASVCLTESPFFITSLCADSWAATVSRPR